MQRKRLKRLSDVRKEQTKQKKIIVECIDTEPQTPVEPYRSTTAPAKVSIDCLEQAQDEEGDYPIERDCQAADGEIPVTEEMKPSDVTTDSQGLLKANIILTARIKRMIEDNERIKARLRHREARRDSSKVDKRIPSVSSNNLRRRTRKRKDEVSRDFACPYPGCDKAYGSENSLNQHMKYKHPGYLAEHKQCSGPNITKQSSRNGNRELVGEEDVFFDDNEHGIKQTSTKK